MFLGSACNTLRKPTSAAALSPFLSAADALSKIFSVLESERTGAQQSTVANARTAKDFNTRRPSASMEPSNYPGARFPGIITPRGKMPGIPRLATTQVTRCHHNCKDGLAKAVPTGSGFACVD